jgi:hypothetical protein
MAQAKNNNDEIGELIKLEEDAKNRAFLIILQNINLSLIANTQTVNDIDEQLKEHLVEFKARAVREDEILNKGRGAWHIVSWVLGSAQIIVIWLVLQTLAEIRDLHKVDALMDNRITVVEQHK